MTSRGSALKSSPAKPLELALGQLEVARARREGDLRAAPGGNSRELLCELTDGGQELGGAALHAADLRHLDAVVLLRERLLGTISGAPGLLGQAFRLVDVAVEQGAHPAQRMGVPEVLRHPQLVGQPRVGGELPVHRGHVAKLQERPEPVGVTPDRGLAVAVSLSQLDQLVGDRQPLARGVRAARE